jgi:hypothetical protein
VKFLCVQMIWRMCLIGLAFNNDNIRHKYREIAKDYSVCNMTCTYTHTYFLCMPSIFAPSHPLSRPHIPTKAKEYWGKWQKIWEAHFSSILCECGIWWYGIVKWHWNEIQFRALLVVSHRSLYFWFSPHHTRHNNASGRRI